MLADTPVTTPVEPTVACALLLLVHTPPDGEELKLVVKPAHTLAVPEIAAGTTPTVMLTEGVIVPQVLDSV